MVIQKQAIFIFLSLLLVFLCTTWSIISQDGMFYTHDFVHGARIVEMQRAVLAGHIPARWSQNFNYGYGMPLFSFYAPLPYLVGALCTLLGASLTTAVKALFIIPSLVTLLGSYLLGRRLFGAAGGVLTAAFITLAPYRAVNLFVRGAVAESWGMMTIPWLLYGLLRIYDNTKDGIGYVIFATSFITLLLSHNLMSLMVIVFAPVMLLALLTPQSRRFFSTWVRMYRNIIVISLLAVGVSAFYTIPAFLERPDTIVTTAVTGNLFDYHLHFVGWRQWFVENWEYGGSLEGPLDGISFFLGWPQLGGSILTMGLLLWYVAHYRKSIFQKTWPSRGVRLVSMLFGVTALLLLLTHRFSTSVWETLSLFSYLQFPWRWLSLASVFMGLLATAWVPLAPVQLRKIFVTVGVAWACLTSLTYFRPVSTQNVVEQHYYSDPPRIAVEMSNTMNDFAPAEFYLPPEGARTGLFSCSGCGQVRDLVEQPHRVRFAVDQATTSLVSGSVAWYPGWQVFVDDLPVATTTDEYGRISWQQPAGTHNVRLVFLETPLRKTADSITLISAVLLGGIVYKHSKHA